MGTFDPLFYSKIMQVGSYFIFLVIKWLDQFLKYLTIYSDIEIDQFDLQND